MDYYGVHLAKVNETNPVRASNDICNSQGVKLVARGDRLSLSKIEVVLKHKLTGPLEQQIAIESSLNATDLYKLLKQVRSSSFNLESLDCSEDLLGSLKHFCSRYEKFPLLRQKLTVLQNQLPEVFKWSLFSAIVGIMIALELELNKNSQEAVFLGGLMHNVGYLHLDPKIVKDGIEVETGSNTAVQLHAKIAKIFLDEVPGLPHSVGDAVGDHHERTDGTGYPKHKMGANLNVESQIIAMTDLLMQGYQQYKDYGGNTHQFLLIKLQLNDNVHFDSVYRATVKLLHGVFLNAKPLNNLPTKSSILSQRKYILDHFEVEKKVALVLMKNLKIKSVRSIGSMVGRLASSLCSSGLIQDEYELGLKDITSGCTEDELADLLRCHIMQNEVESQLERLKNLMNNAIKLFPEEQSEIAHSLAQLQSKLKKAN